MKNYKTLLLGVLAFSLIGFSSVTISAEKVKMERCVGIVKAGQADGQTVIDGEKVDWLLVPAGACQKLVGGRVIADD